MPEPTTATATAASATIPATAPTQGDTPPPAEKQANDPFDDLDSSIFTPEPDEPSRDVKEPAKELPKDDKKQDDKEPFKQPDDKKVEPEPAKAAKVDGVKQLREQLDKIKNESTSIRTERDTLKAKFSEIEKKAKDTTALSEQVATLIKERDQLAAQVASYKYEESPEYKQKFNQPWESAIQSAQNTMKELEVVTAKDPDTGALTKRPAMWNDFNALYGLSEVGARRAARAMFGEDAEVIMRHYDKLHDMDSQMRQAVVDHRSQHGIKQKELQAEEARTREAISEIFTTVNKDILERHPDWKANPEDTQESTLLDESYRLVNSGFGESRETLTMQQRILADAHILHRAATQPLFRHRLQKALAEIAELKAQKEARKSSLPGEPRRETKRPDASSTDEDLLVEAFS